jgi:hypothetical protein
MVRTGIPKLKTIAFMRNTFFFAACAMLSVPTTASAMHTDALLRLVCHDNVCLGTVMASIGEMIVETCL